MGWARSTPAEEPWLFVSGLLGAGTDVMTHPILGDAVVDTIPTIIAAVLAILLPTATMLLKFQPMTPFWGALLWLP